MERKAPDAPLLANDILYVPDNKGRRLTLGALEKMLIVRRGRQLAPLHLRRRPLAPSDSMTCESLCLNQKLFPPPIRAVQPTWYGYDVEPPEQAAVPLAHYLWILRRHRWKILAFVVACVAATLIVSARLTPIYESTVTVDIDRQMPSGDHRPGSHAHARQRRRPVPGHAGQADPVRFRAAAGGRSSTICWMSNERLRRHARAVRRGGSGRPDAPEEAEGHAAAQHLSAADQLPLARPAPGGRRGQRRRAILPGAHLQHPLPFLRRRLATFMEKQLEELKAKMERSTAALVQFERELNVINPEEKTSILSARLLQLNTEYTNAQTDRVRKEAAWKSVQSGSLEAAQVSTQGENLKTLSGKLDEARQKFADVKTHYGANHPEYRKAAVQVDGDRAPVAASAQERRPARRSRIPRGASTARRCCRRPWPRPRPSSTA